MNQSSWNLKITEFALKVGYYLDIVATNLACAWNMFITFGTINKIMTVAQIPTETYILNTGNKNREQVPSSTSFLFDIAEKQSRCEHEWPFYRKGCHLIWKQLCGNYDSIWRQLEDVFLSLDESFPEQIRCTSWSIHLEESWKMLIKNVASPNE